MNHPNSRGEATLRESESQLKIQISRHIIADEKISNVPV